MFYDEDREFDFDMVVMVFDICSFGFYVALTNLIFDISLFTFDFFYFYFLFLVFCILAGTFFSPFLGFL